MNKLLLTIVMAAMIFTGEMAQSAVVTGAGHAAAVQIEPEYRTKIRTYVTEHKVRPVQTRDRRPARAARGRTRGGACGLASRSPSTAMSTRANA